MFRHLLVREIGVWLAIKVAALTAIFLLFFGPEQQIDLSANHVDDQNAAEVSETPAAVRSYISPARISFNP